MCFEIFEFELNLTLKLLFVGELDNHQSDFLPFLSRSGYEVTILNTSHWAFPQKIVGTEMPVLNLYEGNKIDFLFNNRIVWFGKPVLYSIAARAGATIPGITQILKEETDVIFGSWGSHSLPESLLFHRSHVPVTYEFLTYPTLFNYKVKIENALNNKAINKLDGRILTSEGMLRYLRTVFGLKHGENMVFPECYSQKCFYRKRLPRLSQKDGEPHVIFIGTDSCEVFWQIAEMLRRGIHVHVMETENFKQKLGGLKFRKFAHTFKKFDYSKLFDGTLATFMTQFDACLETYGFETASVLDRYYYSTPDRFSFALTAGIPIVMPRGYLLTCEEIIGKHQIGFNYVGYDDLKSKLSDHDLMNFYLKNAVTNSKLFTLENNFERIDKFFRNLTRHAYK